jgi:hypothetical protein
MRHQTERNEILNDAMTEGVEAFMQGQCLTDNPYPYETDAELHQAWERGWLGYSKFYHR